MLKKIGGLARALYILLAIVAGFVALSMMNVPLVIVVLGLIAGLAMPRERMLLVAALVIVLPTVGAALGNIPAIGAQLTAVAANLQLGCGCRPRQCNRHHALRIGDGRRDRDRRRHKPRGRDRHGKIV